MSAVRVAVSGGIGSGKSVVCRMLRAMGFRVYDTDARAKALMDRDAGIQRRLCEEIHPLAVREGCIDRPLVASVVFASAPKLEALDRIVHSAVRRDLEAWYGRHGSDPVLFVETAILYRSGLDRMVDRVWEVSAPDALRVSRVMARNGLSASEVCARIDAQRFIPDRPHPSIAGIINDGIAPLLPQVEGRLSEILLSNQTPSTLKK